jgi:hypothetical protein
MNSLIFRQRVEQAAQYLETCNAKAQRKRRLLEAALQLWQATKELSMSPSKRRAQGLLEADAMTITGTAGVTVDVPLLRGVGPSEIHARAKELQRTTLEDMHKPPNAHLQQVRLFPGARGDPARRSRAPFSPDLTLAHLHTL